jgi:L-threonylcarbamoyladenylate synthase
MARLHKTFSRDLAKRIKRGAVGVLPTDTIYGLVGSAFSFEAIHRIDVLRKRDLAKPFIILISSIGDLESFGVKLDDRTTNILKEVWPGKVSVLLPALNKKFLYLHRGTERIAFRLPSKKDLREFLRISGPVVAPSANWGGEPAALNIREARRYFGDEVDFYLDRGNLKSLPSTLVSMEGSKLRILRQGAVKIAKSIAL